ncbi:GDP-fucose protein O-fucosyltransferase 1-like [Branchiostoma floridae]|uniref:GDP-fucose protein O-fucosyltransferase 1 n=1 Tax=Branchiostoma floridae TaxID=7739 RepID=C3Y161_BRAFL|nr:GDP-fucose protein O-fucosyltransferase 1-like [Branchiostoma floridae]|eukprot:XP_002609591.1 hypothetical protein BRAFLDRAFT_87806 [Branchiostoma floridae]
MYLWFVAALLFAGELSGESELEAAEANPEVPGVVLDNGAEVFGVEGALKVGVAKPRLEWDPNGYVLFCPCMGRFGNQAEHFLGGLAFAKAVNRTLALPPWRTDRNVPFSEWFKVEPLQSYHRVVSMEAFLEQLAPVHWPPGRRKGYCWRNRRDTNAKCGMKEGNPFGPFWDHLGVDFDEFVFYEFTYQQTEAWTKEFPPSSHPVLAFKGAPASFPMKAAHRQLQEFLQWTSTITVPGQDFIQTTFQGRPYIGIHLRNGPDFERACANVEGTSNFMASPQCTDIMPGRTVTHKMCFPSREEILRKTKNAILATRAKFVFVATDNDPLVEELEQHLKSLKVKVHHLNPHLPQLDLYILGQAQHFIGNCVSSFTSFVKRERDVHNRTSSFWGVD